MVTRARGLTMAMVDQHWHASPRGFLESNVSQSLHLVLQLDAFPSLLLC